MPKLPRLTGFQRSQDFAIVRIRGSHHVMQSGTLHTVVPVHGAQTLRIGTLRGILRDLDLSAVEFSERWSA